MTNNPHLHYRSDVFLNTPVEVTLDAADWIAFMAWVMKADTDGVSYIIYKVGDQVMKAVYTAASIKTADATYAEESENTIKTPFGIMKIMRVGDDDDEITP